MIVIGATNAGKSTFLLSTTKMQGFFNIAAVRETANIWRFKLDA
jgi:GTP-binding protein EngB required for normal cell division